MKKIATRTGLMLLVLMVSSSLWAGDADISVFRPAVNPRDKKDRMVMAAAEYTKQTGGKVSFIQGDWGTLTSKIVSNLAAGTPIDVVYGGAHSFPRFYTKGYVQPINGWVNLKAPNLNIPVMDKYFKFNGKYYLASNRGSNHSRIVMFNKTLLEEEGIPAKEMPDALYKAGKWDFEHLRALAIKLTKDTDGDGKIDRKGIGGYDYSMFVYGNGATFTTIDSKGQYKLNFDDPNLIAGLDYLYKASTEGWFNPNNGEAAQGLQRRTLGMYIEGSWMTEQIQKDTKDQIVAVPIPLGPGNTKKVYPFGADGYTIGAGSKKQKFAGKYIDICCKLWDEFDMEGRAGRPKYILDFLSQTGKNQVIVGSTEGVLETVLNDILGTIAWGSALPRERLEAVRPLAQNLVDDANIPATKIERLPFKNFLVDFEDGDASAFKVVDAKQSGVKLSVISDARAIEGKSLLVETDFKKDGSPVYIATSSDGPVSAVGYRNYMISMDVKLLGDPGSEKTAVTLNLYRDEKNMFGNINRGLYTKDEVVSVTDMIKDVFKNGKFGFRLGLTDSGAVVIDNIKVKEVK